jgi:hypothetical protein
MNGFTKKELKEQYKNRICIGGIYCVKCTESSKRLLRSTIDLKGSKNRFEFSLLINVCPEKSLIEDWKLYGASSFTFEILEEITKKETQSEKEFADDVATLLEIWSERWNDV